MSGPQYSVRLRLILGLFFSWGMLTCLNDTLVPHLREAFALSYFHAILIPVTFFTTCLVFAPLSSFVIGRVGYARSMVAALVAMGLGATCFLPAAHLELYSCFLLAISILGAGITLLQTSAGPYIAFCGPANTATHRYSLALGLNSLGTMVAPLFGGLFILRGATGYGSADGHGMSSAMRLQAMVDVQRPYLFLGVALFVLAGVLGWLKLPEPVLDQTLTTEAPLISSVFRHKPLVFGAVAIFLYAGAEVGIGSFLISYLSLPEILGSSQRSSAFLASFYWGGAVVGRLGGWVVLRRWPVERLLALVSTAAAVLVALAVMTNGPLSAVSLLAVGLCNALVVPIVVMLAISGLGPLTSRASSVMVAANIGAGLVSLALGGLADRVGVHHALSLTILCYVSVLLYALRGSKGHLMQSQQMALAD